MESGTNRKRRIAVGQQHAGSRRDARDATLHDALAEVLVTPMRRVENDLPDDSGPGLRQMEIHRRVPGVAQEQQMPIGHAVRVGESMADQHPDGTGVPVVPIGSSQLMTQGMTPAHILVLAIDLPRALEKGVAPQSRRLLTQQEQLTGETDQPIAARRQVPVEPTELVILTVGVVVAMLS